MFKVVPDQLRISDGWVRCGQCDEVFDANAHLQPAFDTAPVAVPRESPEVLDWGGMLGTEAKTPDPAISLEFPAKTTSEFPTSVEAVDLDPIPSAFAYESRGKDLEDLASVGSDVDVDVAIDPLDAIPKDSVVLPGASEIQSDLEQDPVGAPVAASVPEAVDTPQFLKTDLAPAAKGDRASRFVWASLSALLVCALAVQVVVQERDRIVATAPSMATWLQPVCQVLGCRISPLQQIEAIVIDHSSFSKAQSEGYVLGFAVKSTALTEVAIPSLELTLTDMQDRAVVRRVFSPRELGYQSQVLSPGGEWSGSVPVDVKLADGSERISGYRLLAFYP